jgi:NAD(P)-dependent dehydrogenase (short-subunit alcohol dehydrogenase family)
MTEKLSDDLQKKMLEMIPLGRYGSPDDVAGAVAFWRAMTRPISRDR